MHDQHCCYCRAFVCRLAKREVPLVLMVSQSTELVLSIKGTCETSLWFAETLLNQTEDREVTETKRKKCFVFLMKRFYDKWITFALPV